MTRWTEEFNNHAFQKDWEALKTELSIVEIDDQSIVTSVQELARLKQVISYIDGIIKAIIPELTPKSVWDNFAQQTAPCLTRIRAYVSERSINHIREANSNADNLLSYVKPFLVAPSDAIISLRNSSTAYTNEFEKSVNTFKEKISNNEQIIKQLAIDASNQINTIAKHFSTIEDYRDQLFTSKANNPSIKSVIDELTSAINQKSIEIDSYYQKLIKGSEESKSVQTQIDDAYRAVIDANEKIASLLIDVTKESRALKEFHSVVFGKSTDDGVQKSGLKLEIDKRKTEIDSLNELQAKKFDAIFNKIEALLPGATSAGLASAYEILERTFIKRVRNYTYLFYGALFFLIFGALVHTTKEIDFYPTFKIIWVEISDWDTIFKGFLYKTTFIAPVVWLALFATARRNQYERLQQEYAHKKALASSYESYRLQLLTLGQEGNDLQINLLHKAIDAISFNASSTLDKKQVERISLFELFDKFNPSETKEIILSLLDKIGKSK